jgi:hypothetical protein
VKTALDSTRSAYTRLSNGKAPAKVLLDDKKLHHDLRTAVDAIRDRHRGAVRREEEARAARV